MLGLHCGRLIEGIPALVRMDMREGGVFQHRLLTSIQLMSADTDVVFLAHPVHSAWAQVGTDYLSRHHRSAAFWTHHSSAGEASLSKARSCGFT